jgi:hypothetical protein
MSYKYDHTLYEILVKNFDKWITALYQAKQNG